MAGSIIRRPEGTDEPHKRKLQAGLSRGAYDGDELERNLFARHANEAAKLLHDQANEIDRLRQSSRRNMAKTITGRARLTERATKYIRKHGGHALVERILRQSRRN